MSRGPGNLQRTILATLRDRARLDRFPGPWDEGISDFLSADIDVDVVRARWRWYTVDLLGLATPDTPRSARVSLHRAIGALERSHEIEVVRRKLPYSQPFGGHIDRYERLVGGIDLAELTDVDSRWPARPRQVVWFRLPPPHPDYEGVPADDQIAVIDAIEGEWTPEPFEDFVGSIDPLGRWYTPVGEFLTWIFCGSRPEDCGRGN
ncbi:hypothetical protein [Mycolicibacterium porcinum]|uniref:hypothetical protein n=1 Tax=Mycolicibacterium porcinum TaxID=39693 RepID=UPI000A64C10D|nr:hypothetical protein [Mycolicibacterium porcinum]